MTTRTRLVRILAVVFAFGLVAAACGDDDEAATSRATTWADAP